MTLAIPAREILSHDSHLLGQFESTFAAEVVLNTPRLPNCLLSFKAKNDAKPISALFRKLTKALYKLAAGSS